MEVLRVYSTHVGGSGIACINNDCDTAHIHALEEIYVMYAIHYQSAIRFHAPYGSSTGNKTHFSITVRNFSVSGRWLCASYINPIYAH